MTLSSVIGRTTTDLLWLITVPHTIDHVVMVARENEQRTRRIARRASGGDTETADRRQIGGHSDPTGDAAVARLGETAAETTSTIDAAVDLCHEATMDLEVVIAAFRGSEWTLRTPAPNRMGKLSAVVAWLPAVALQIDACADAMTVRDRGDLEHLARVQLADTAAWLRAKADAVLHDAPMEDRDQPEQRALRYCACCEPMGYREIVAPRSDLCPTCHTFRAEYKCWPTKAIRDDRAMGRKRITPGQLAELAKAPKRKRKTA